MAQERSLKAILFDFDATLTCVSEVPRHRIYPGFDSQQPDVKWLRDVAFGGESRLDLMLQTLRDLRDRWHVELFIVSFAEKDTIVRTLTLLDGLSIFGSENIFGWQEMGGPFVKKGQFVTRFMQDRAWNRADVLFVDDQPDNIRSVEPACLCYWVRNGRGLTEDEFRQLQQDSGIQLAYGFQAATMQKHEDVRSDRTNQSARSSLNSNFSEADERINMV